MPRPSLFTALNNRLCGPLIGRRDLTSEQWQEVHDRSYRGSMRPLLITLLCACTPFVIYIFANRYGTLAPKAVPGMTVQQLAAAHSAFTSRFGIINAILLSFLLACPALLPFPHRRLVAPHIRAATNSLGLSNVCTRCGYPLTNHPVTTSICPECGKARI